MRYGWRYFLLWVMVFGWLVESEAENVARQASLALKRSRRRINAQPGVPTWTGQHGMAGAPRVTYVSTHTSTTLSSADAKY